MENYFKEVDEEVVELWKVGEGGFFLLGWLWLWWLAWIGGLFLRIALLFDCLVSWLVFFELGNVVIGFNMVISTYWFIVDNSVAIIAAVRFLLVYRPIVIVVGNRQLTHLIKDCVNNLHRYQFFIFFCGFHILPHKLSDLKNSILPNDPLHTFLHQLKRDSFLKLQVLKKQVIGLVGIEVLLGKKPASHQWL